MPLVTMIAGPNGSGKSTLIAHLQDRGLLRGDYFNADDIARLAGSGRLAARHAQAQVRALRAQALAERRDHAWETVMSHPSHVEHLRDAKALGCKIHVHYVATEDPLVSILRVRDRVSQGGHDVPIDRIRARYHASIAGLADALVVADFAIVYDNSERTLAFRPVCTVAGDVMRLAAEIPNCPVWFMPVLNGLIGRMAVLTPERQS